MSTTPVTNSTEQVSSSKVVSMPVEKKPSVEDPSATMKELLDGLNKAFESGELSSKIDLSSLSSSLTGGKNLTEIGLALSKKIEADTTGQARVTALQEISRQLSAIESLLVEDPAGDEEDPATSSSSAYENPFLQKTSASFVAMANVLAKMTDSVGQSEYSLSEQSQFKTEADVTISKKFTDEAQAQYDDVLAQIKKINHEKSRMKKAGVWQKVGMAIACVAICLVAGALGQFEIVAATVMLTATVESGAVEKLTSLITKSLQKSPCNMGEKDAKITASILTAVILALATVGTCGAGGMLFAAEEGAATGAAESGALAAEEGSSTAAYDAANPLNLSASTQTTLATARMVFYSTLMADGFWTNMANSVGQGKNQDVIIALTCIGIFMCLSSGYSTGQAMAAESAANSTKTAVQAAETSFARQLQEMCSFFRTTPQAAATRISQVLLLTGGAMQTAAMIEMGDIYADLADSSKLLAEALAEVRYNQAALSTMSTDVQAASDMISQLAESLTYALSEGLSYQRELTRILA